MRHRRGAAQHCLPNPDKLSRVGACRCIIEKKATDAPLEKFKIHALPYSVILFFRYVCDGTVAYSNATETAPYADNFRATCKYKLASLG